MTQIQIEKLLRRAPCPAAPADLLKTLLADIELPHTPAPRWSRADGLPNLLRRWMPAFAFSVFLFSCVVLIGVQTHWVSRLKQENRGLRATAANLEALRAAHADYERQRALVSELERLRKANQDLQRLRAEVSGSRELPVRIKELRAENQQLLAATVEAGNTAAADAFFEEARKEAERVACVNNLKQMGLSFRLWSLDNENRHPTSVLQMSNELHTAKVLICPSDKAKQAFVSLPWSEFQPAMTSYQLRLSGEIEEVYPDSVISKCPIHHNYGLADGSVQSIDPAKYREETINGRTYLKPIEGKSATQP